MAAADAVTEQYAAAMDEAIAAATKAERERDAARAEVARLREELAAVRRQSDWHHNLARHLRTELVGLPEETQRDVVYRLYRDFDRVPVVSTGPD